MNTTSSIIERRDQRITARLRRIQGQIVSLERPLPQNAIFQCFFNERRQRVAR